MNILVTGAAGYIGSVVTERLLDVGHSVVALDNLQQGHREAIDSRSEFVYTDFGDKKALDKIFSGNKIEGVMHLAANSIVSESVTNPRKYFKTTLPVA
jgi:UDP-glucose 4-epimerase